MQEQGRKGKIPPHNSLHSKTPARPSIRLTLKEATQLQQTKHYTPQHQRTTTNPKDSQTPSAHHTKLHSSNNPIHVVQVDSQKLLEAATHKNTITGDLSLDDVEYFKGMHFV